MNLFYVNPYKAATYSEYYAQLRALAKKQEIAGSHLMNDTYLFEKADTAVLEETYQDIMELTKIPEKKLPLTGFREFVANVFGIAIISRKDEENEVRKLKIQSEKEILAGIVSVIEHEPRELEELADAGVDVDLCGHTHDGQMFPGNPNY